MLLPGPLVRVALEVKGDEGGETELEVQPEWGGTENDGSDVTELKVLDSKGGAVAADHPAPTRWVVRHAPSEHLSVSYIIPSRTLPPTSHGNDYRTKLDGTFFHMIGELGLLLPKRFDDETARDLSIEFHGFDRDGWTVASSFGSGPGPFAMHESGRHLRHGLVVGGKMRVLTREIRGSTVGIAITGEDWGFTDDAFADLTAKIVDAERSFWKDDSDPWFLVALTPNGGKAGQGFSLGGTGLTNCFALYCNTGLSLDEGSKYAIQVKALLAHEYFHTWNGGKIPSAGEDGTGYWFSEGFTDFYARRLLLDAGMISEAEFLERLNEMLGRAFGNSERAAPASRIKDYFWKNREVQRLPYERGDQVALAVDERIREVSGGARSLDDLMTAVLEQVRSGKAYSTDLVLELIAQQTDGEFAASIRRAVVEGAEVPLPVRLTRPGAARVMGESRSFDAGFDTDATAKSKVVSGVREGTAAHAAGLRDGQRLKGLSISSGGPGEAPSAKVTIDEDGERRVIVYDPLTPPISVPAYKARP
jgi:predicted metalloprotease with PDZ domain